MASSLRAGHSILRAMDSVAHEAAAPTSEEFTRLVNETRVGRDLGEALDEIAERTKSEDFAWVAQAIAIQREVGGNLAEVLDAVGHTIRERNAIRRQVKALSAEGKLSAAVLMALPFGIIAFLSMANPEYLAGFTESIVGYGMLAVAAVMMTVGGLWLRSTVRIRF
jgi:tight adherence protein B